MNFNVWKKLNTISLMEQYIDGLDIFPEERDILKWYIQEPSAILFEMANVLGNSVSIEHRLPFSFFFSSKGTVHGTHAIRIKVCWNPSKYYSSADGYIELHGEYKYVVSSHKYKPTSKELSILRDFVRKYKVLFAAVWEEKLDPNALQNYFAGQIKLKELISKFQDVTEKQYYELNHATNLQELEEVVRKTKAFNMND